jgi:thioredoxin 1
MIELSQMLRRRHMAEPTSVTDDNFDEEVLQASLPVITDFWADWCGPCHAIAPIIEQIAAEYDGQLKVTRLDVDSNPLTPTLYGIRGIPTLIVFKNGQPVETLVGWMPKEQLLNKLRPHIETE